jgi:hypothetical protein
MLFFLTHRLELDLLYAHFAGPHARNFYLDLARDSNGRLIPVLETPSRRRPDFAHGAKLKL